MSSVFPEITEQDTAAADVGFSILLHALQLLYIDALLSAFRSKFSKQDEVREGIEEQSVAGQSVPSGTAYFLIETLDAFGQIVVNDPSYITLVDAHAESDCGAYYLYTVIDEIILCPVPFVGR